MRRVLLTTSGNANRGSWAIRGRQLSEAIGGTEAVEATNEQIAKADLVVVVKKASPELLNRIRKRGVPWILDIVDCWPQPLGNSWAPKQAVEWLRGHVERLNPIAVVCATAAMERDLADLRPALTLYHHARPGMAVNALRDDVKVVGYEGSERYIDGWRLLLEAECRARGWQFVVNPTSLADVDIVVALRGGQWNGWAPREWKSNVKLANAQGSGTPIICQRDCGYVETASGGEKFIDTPDDLGVAFDYLADATNRRFLAGMMRAQAPRIEAVALEYHQWLESL